ncbi:MAG TPA: asparagine synthase-related protein [Nitrosopumilaceae archaeon]|nr:asparagine synthase-related protein [Nitrosopumilaceae archaeon]
MEEISKKLYNILKEACDSCKADTISLSGGLDSTILTYYLKEKKPKTIAIISRDFPSNDLTFCQLASKQFDVPLTINNVDTVEMLESIKGTISILKNFNDIEIRNNIVMYLAIKWARDNGSNGIITGDGADELFAGYAFLLTKLPDELEKEIKRICSIMHFPTQKIGKALGVAVESPYLDEKVIELARNIPVNLKVKTENGKKFGKWILRKTFEKKIPIQIAWREKSAMQDGAGTSGLTNLFDVIISDEYFSEKKKKTEQEDGIIIRSKESMYYFETYKNLHGLPKNSSDTDVSCPYCHFSTENSRFCRMCGAFPI